MIDADKSAREKRGAITLVIPGLLVDVIPNSIRCIRAEGLEPPRAVSKTAVLPLDDTRMCTKSMAACTYQLTLRKFCLQDTHGYSVTHHLGYICNLII